MKKNAERWMELCALAAKESDPNKLILSDHLKSGHT